MAENTVRFGYSSSANSSFRGTLDTGITRTKWAAMSAHDREQETDTLLYELVDLFELADNEPDYRG